MADWQTCYDWMMANEDGPPPYRYKTVTDNKGSVISGINSNAFPNEFKAINDIPQAERGPAVESFYNGHFWNPWIAQLSTDAAKRILDAEVNLGQGTAVKIAQLAAGSEIDGHWGPNTVAAILGKSDFVESFKEARLAHYRTIAQANPDDAKYLGTENDPGPWWRRAIA